MQDFVACKVMVLPIAEPKPFLLKIKKNVLVMKITAVLLLATLQVAAKGWGQDQISLSFSNAPLEQVFSAITAQTSIAFLYRPEYVKDKKVTVKITNASLKAVLDICLKDQKLVYQIVGKTVAIHPAHKVNSVSGTEGITNTPPVDVKGRIVDSKGEAISNATVSVKGSVKNTITNANGEFTLSDVEEDAVLIISHVQYEMESIVLKGNKSVTVSLQIKVNSLDEMQVIAYGTTTKRFNTGNIASVKADDIAKQPVNNPLLALQGRVPGLFITQNSGLSGGGVSALIQGQNSISRGNDPFIVIDGVPYISQLMNNLGNVLRTSGVNTPGQGNPLNYINSADIESVTILKDADATAIYGSRAANGAILITTKKGKAGETRIDADVIYGWSRVNNRIDLMDTQQFLEMRNEAINNDGRTPAYEDFELTLWDTTRYTDWQKELIGRTAKLAKAHVSVSGGNANMQFRLGGTFQRETTVFPGDFKDQRGAVHFSLNNTSRNQRLKLQLTCNYMADNNQVPDADLTFYAIGLAPNAPPLYNPDGSYNWAPDPNGISSWINPLSQFLNRYSNKTNNLVGNAQIGYRLLTGLSINANLGYTNLQMTELVKYPLLSSAPENRPSLERGASYGNSSINSWLVEPTLNYSTAIKSSKLEVLIGTTIQQRNTNSHLVSGSGYISDEVLGSMSSAAKLAPISSTLATYKYNAIFGRVNYNWKDKYILNLAGRRDGTSRFGSENRFHNFGSVGIAWVFSKEDFLGKSFDWLSLGKLRSSYGTIGNDQISDYLYLSLYRPVNVTEPYQGGVGLTPSGLTNPALQWEETKKLSFGIDLGVLQNKILVSADFYRNRSSNQLLQTALPSSAGFTGIVRNFPAVVQNTGWEFLLRTINIKTGGFEWTSTINLTIPQNKLIRYDSLSTSNDAARLVVGQPITLIRAFHLLGVDPATGQFYFSDGKGNVTFNPKGPDDNTVNINTGPTLYGGFENTFSYKGFQLDVLFQFVKRKGLNFVFGSNNPGSYYLNQPTWVLDRWKKPDDVTIYPKFTSDGSAILPFDAAASRSDAALIDASFIRLKNVQLSWQLPSNWNQKHVRDIRVFAQGQNLATITNYIGLDPETLSVSTLPPLRVLTVGVHIGL